MDRTVRPVAAIVGGGSLLGRELRDLLAGAPLETRLIGADIDEAGTLTELGGEAVVLTELDESNLEGARVVLLAGSPESTRKTLEILARFRPGPALVDLTYGIEDRPGASLRAPMAEPANYMAPAVSEHLIAHPAAIILALFLARLQQVQPVRRAVAHVFEPASERGHRGIEELEKQTVNLLTFKQLPKNVYDEQVGFNLLARYGGQALESLGNVELRIERHLASLLALHGPLPMPSVRVIQVPVFHGHSISLWVEFETNPGVATLEQALATPQIDVRSGELDPPNIIGMAGQDGIAVGAIATDRNDAAASWFWIAADNIRIMAGNAAAVARSVAGRAGTARPQ